jgi:replication fork protection complex subunit Csm3/Swi3
MYQLWLDDLYPRAKFADGLAIIEKLGHQKRLQTMRREWIDEGKPKHDNWDDVPTGPHDSTRQTETQSEQQASDEAGHPPSGSTARPMPSTRDNGDLFLTDDEDGSLPKPAETNGAGHPPEDEMDELDALMAEDQAGGAGPQAGATRAKDRVDDRRPDDDFADDMEAMAEMDMW